ncbi:hypothetical protein [Aliidiomarina quisquiliarum]|uniref:hypothetical protein n=1 Tax=Aliidiomarina quisquiliarum TaxID=2938947 RepID=UPI00208FEEAE|nr:hypothetical protein [Aliidiomarina quisquiliarum]MCO4319943.1 hypothetical protein [Aliidiomarina quisquiliarum]
MIQLVKCALIGTPTLLLGRALYESLDIIPVVSSIEEIINILASAKELPKPNRNRALEYFYFIMTRGQDFYFSNPIHWFKVEANNRINEIVEQLEAKTGIALFGVNDISKKLFYTLGIGKVFCFIDNSVTNGVKLIH